MELGSSQKLLQMAGRDARKEQQLEATGKGQYFLLPGIRQAAGPFTPAWECPSPCLPPSHCTESSPDVSRAKSPSLP